MLHCSLPWPDALTEPAPAVNTVLTLLAKERDEALLEAYATSFDLGSGLSPETPSLFRLLIGNALTFRLSAHASSHPDPRASDYRSAVDTRFSLDAIHLRLVDLTAGTGWYGLGTVLADKLNGYRRGVESSALTNHLTSGPHVSLEVYFAGNVQLYSQVVDALIRNHVDKVRTKLRPPDPPVASRSAFRKPALVARSHAAEPDPADDAADYDEWTAEPADALAVMTRSPGPLAAPAFTCLVCKLPGHRVRECPVLMQPAVQLAITNAQARASGSAQPAPSPAPPSAPILKP